MGERGGGGEGEEREGGRGGEGELMRWRDIVKAISFFP